VQDFFRFAQMLLNKGALDGARVLGVKSVELMVRNHVSPELLKSAGWGEYGWGLGTSVRMSLLSDGLGSVGAFGWNGGTGTLYLVDPGEKLVVVVFIPSQPGTPGVSQARDDFVAAAYQAIVAGPSK
jgi:CubicO group peptidase (beta-lactamase class C family)